MIISNNVNLLPSFLSLFIYLILKKYWSISILTLILLELLAATFGYSVSELTEQGE